MIALNVKIAFLKGLEGPDGHIDPAAVVTAAAIDTSPMHSYFEWDDSIAGAKYRLQQAVSLIRSMRTVLPVENIPFPLTLPTYVRDLRAETSGYRRLEDIRSEQEIARQTVLDAMHRASNAIRRAKSLAVYLDIEELVEQAEQLVADIVARTRRDVNDRPEGAA